MRSLVAIALVVLPAPAVHAREILPDSPELALARFHLSHQQYELALEKLRTADDVADKRRADVALLLSATYYRLGAYKNAEKTARRAIALSTDDPEVQAEAQLVLARTLIQAEDKRVDGKSARLQGAEEAFRQAIALGSQAETAPLGLADTLYRLDREADARATLEAFLKKEGLSDAAAARARQVLDNPRCAAGPCLPKLSFVAADGRKLTEEDLRGKVVMLSFWATWCGPCRAAMPDLKKMHARYEKEPFVMVGINRDDDRRAMNAYVEEQGLRWPQIVDEASDRLQTLMGVDAIPAEILFDHDGVLIARTRGWSSRTEEALAVRIREALGRARKAGDSPSPSSP